MEEIGEEEEELDAIEESPEDEDEISGLVTENPEK